jgi:3-deoxy-7-phosphoheptulonate synthase
MGVTEQGIASIVKTRGNQDVHVILRGGTSGTNFSSEHVHEAANVIAKALPRRHPSIMIDCSHGNSQKNHNNQPKVLDDICAQLRSGDRSITGVMIESNINEGKQDVPHEGPSGLKYGVSITDACVDWQTTVGMLDRLNIAVQERRSALIDASLNKTDYRNGV